MANTNEKDKNSIEQAADKVQDKIEEKKEEKEIEKSEIKTIKIEIVF